MATATTIQTTTVAFSSQRLSGSNDDDENSKKKSEESSFTSSSSSSSSQRIREATFLATFENFQSDFQRLKAKAIKARENTEEEYFYEEKEGEEEETTFGKKMSSSSASCEFCGPHCWVRSEDARDAELNGMRASEWDAPVEVDVRCEGAAGKEDFSPSAYQYLTRVKKISKKSAQSLKPRTHRVHGEVAFEEPNARRRMISNNRRRSILASGVNWRFKLILKRGKM